MRYRATVREIFCFKISAAGKAQRNGALQKSKTQTDVKLRDKERGKMTHQKKKILILSAAAVIAAVAAVLITLAFTIWRPKNTREWLNDFQNSLIYNRNNMNQRIERQIQVTENEKQVSNFYQLVEIKEQEGGTVAHIIVQETYPGLDTLEFDIYDEYFFYNEVMYMYRKNGEDVVSTKFPSDWNVFWEIANENIGGTKYNFSEGILTDLEMSHAKGEHTLSAAVSEEKKREFFGGTEDRAVFTSVRFHMALNETLRLTKFEMTYAVENKQNVRTTITQKEPETILIKDFAKE